MARYKAYKAARRDMVPIHRRVKLTLHSTRSSCTPYWYGARQLQPGGMDMDFAFFVIIRDNGMFLFGSNTLSECIDMAQRHVKVEIDDMFGQVWGAH